MTIYDPILFAFRAYVAFVMTTVSIKVIKEKIMLKTIIDFHKLQ